MPDATARQPDTIDLTGHAVIRTRCPLCDEPIDVSQQAVVVESDCRVALAHLGCVPVVRPGEPNDAQ